MNVPSGDLQVYHDTYCSLMAENQHHEVVMYGSLPLEVGAWLLHTQGLRCEAVAEKGPSCWGTQWTGKVLPSLGE